MVHTLQIRDTSRFSLGTWLKLPAIETAEIAAYAQFDFVVIDLEHTTLNLQTAYQLIGTSTALGMTPLVRVPDHRASTIQRILDAGAAGIVAPHVDTPLDAEALARATRFPPRGLRGSGGTSRAGRWGLLPRAEYLQTGNEDVLCIAQLESEAGMRKAAEILSIDGIDGILVGTADLSLEMGIPATGDRIQQLIDDVISACRTAHKPCGAACADPATAIAAARNGFTFTVMSNDASMLARTATSAVQEVRQQYGS
jgi:2-keto-3-deoxy-L-rhamnonate aldolase RhmA